MYVREWHFCKELSLGFGDYCEVYDGTDNTTRSRSLPCVALYPCCNLTGSWVFYSITMKTRIRRTQWKKMITSKEISENMNALDPDAVALELVGEIGQHIPSQELQAEEVTGESEEVGEKPASKPSGDPAMSGETVDEEVENDAEIPDLVNQEAEDSDDEAEEEADDEDHEDNGASPMQLRRSGRIRDGVKRPSHYAMVTRKVQSNSIGNKGLKQSLNKAEEDKIRLVFEELDAMEPIRKEDIPKGYKAHNTHLFPVENVMADGKHDKFKSRLVAHGNDRMRRFMLIGYRQQSPFSP
jgi:hypothetical protein